MKKVVVIGLMVLLVPFLSSAQAVAGKAQNSILVAQQGTTVMPELTPAPPPTIYRETPPATPPQPPQQPKTQAPAKKTEPAKPSPAKGKNQAASPLDWGTDYWHGSFRGNWWNADYASKFKVVEDVNGEPQGMTVDIKDRLKLETPASVWEAEIWARPSKRNRIFASYMFSSYRGHVDILKEQIDVADKSFPAHVDVRTKLTNNRATLFYQFLPWANERGGIGPFLGVEYYQYMLELTSNATDEKYEQRLNLPIPVLGLEGDYTIGYGLGFWARAAGIGANIENISASYFDIDAGVSFKWKLLFAGVGYRWLMYNIEAGEKNKDGYLKLDTDQTGLLATVGLNF